MKFTLSAPSLDAKFDGRFTATDGPRLQGQAELKTRKVRGLARWFGIAVASSPDLRDASVAGQLDWSGGRLALSDATVSFDGNQGTGALSLKTGLRPFVEGTLAFDAFNTAIYTGAPAQWIVPSGDLPSGNKAAVSTDPSILKSFDADLRLSASKVLVSPVETGRGAAAVKLRNGRLQVDIAELEIESGSLGGQVTVDATGDTPRTAVKAKLSSIDPGRVFSDSLKRNPLLGRANITFDVVGTGHSLRETWGSLGGKGAVTLVGSGKLGLDLSALLYAARQKASVGWSAAGKGGTGLDKLDGRFNFSRGAITFDPLQFQSGTTSYFGTGKFDLPGRLLDINLAVGPATASEAPLTAHDMLLLRGTWDNPEITVQQPQRRLVPAAQGRVD